MTQLNDSIPASEALSLQEELQKLSSMPVEDMMNALRRIISTRTAEMQLSMGVSDYKGNGGSKWNN